jgi:hypothetical protein
MLTTAESFHQIDRKVYISIKYHLSIMVNRMVHLRVPEKLYKDSESLTKEFGFSNVQDFFRNAVHRAIEEYNRQVAWAKVKALYGTDSKLTRITPKEREKWAREFVKKAGKGYNPLKEIGL